MKKISLIITALVLTLMSTGCAKSGSAGKNAAAKNYFDAWMTINHPELSKTGIGIYIMEDEPGTGSSISDIEENPYIYLEYTITDLDGTITSTTYEETAKQLGTYESSSYYGPVVMLRNTSNVTAGAESMLSSMLRGGTRKAIIPGWLETSERYDTEEEYLEKTSGSDAIYKVHIVDAFKDVIKWQTDSIENYLRRNHMPTDSLENGLYFIQTQAPTDTTSLKSGEKMEINYTGMLLNGKVFDTTIKDAAKDAGIYNASKTYGTSTITLASEYGDVKLEDNSTIDGFSKAMMHLKEGMKATVIFTSVLGYGTSSSSSAIPAYSPLRFDLEVVSVERSE